MFDGYFQSSLDNATDAWGVQVERVEVKDCRVPDQLMRAMAAEAEAARDARAKVIAAEGEHKASRSLRMAADVIMESPAALQVDFYQDSSNCSLQLRYLQTLNSIAAENNSTIIFPIPIDILSHFMQGPQHLAPPAPTHQVGPSSLSNYIPFTEIHLW